MYDIWYNGIYRAARKNTRVLHINGVHVTFSGTGNKNNNIICKELTVVYCPDVLKGSLKSLACVISGKLRSVAPSTYFFRSHFRCERKFPYSVRAFEKFSCIFERVRFSSYSRRQTEKKYV